MPSAALDLADRLELLAGTHAVAGHAHADRDDKPAVAACRVCGAPVRTPRRVYCSARCLDVVHGRASELDQLGRVDRERVQLRERAASLLLRASVRTAGPLDDSEPRVPGDIAARIAGLDAWAAKLRGGRA